MVHIDHPLDLSFISSIEPLYEICSIQLLWLSTGWTRSEKTLSWVVGPDVYDPPVFEVDNKMTVLSAVQSVGSQSNPSSSNPDSSPTVYVVENTSHSIEKYPEDN